MNLPVEVSPNVGKHIEFIYVFTKETLLYFGFSKVFDYLLSTSDRTCVNRKITNFFTFTCSVYVLQTTILTHKCPHLMGFLPILTMGRRPRLKLFVLEQKGD